jgi:pantothenate synthetase
MKKWRSLSLRPEKKEESLNLKSALRTLECSVDSGSKQISNWEEAKEVLSSLVQFPDKTLPSDHVVSRTSHEVEEYRNRIKEAWPLVFAQEHITECRTNFDQSAEVYKKKIIQ